MTEYSAFLLLDRIIGRLRKEEEEFSFLASACFKSQVRKPEELKASPQKQKLYMSTVSPEIQQSMEELSKEKCVLSASLPALSGITPVDFSAFQQDGAINVFRPQNGNSQRGIKIKKKKPVCMPSVSNQVKH